MKTKTQPLNVRASLLSFSNPRRLAVFHNWPAGNQTVTCEFAVQRDDSGRERVLRWTRHKPKTTYWYDWCRIVDGDDRRTYVICYEGDRRTEPVDNQGRHCPVEGQAVIYSGSLDECVVTNAGPIFRMIQSMRNLTNG